MRNPKLLRIINSVIYEMQDKSIDENIISEYRHEICHSYNTLHVFRIIRTYQDRFGLMTPTKKEQQ